MKYWTSYQGHLPDIRGKRKLYDNTIYTFDIETSSFLTLYGKQLETIKYLDLSDSEKEDCKMCSTMYIWMFSINDEVYYGRTYEEFYSFLEKIEKYTMTQSVMKIIYVHNLSFEFQFLRNIFEFENVLSRKSRKVIKCDLKKLNYQFRCSLYMTNCKLEKLPQLYKLDVEKKVGDLDYSKIRHSRTKLSKKELKYCENDCLVVYEYIKKELETYSDTKYIPLTATGHVRQEFKEKINDNYKYKNKTKKSINTNGHMYNLLTSAFAGGYTHANWIYADTIIHNVYSYDFTSSYPYVMVTHKFPMTEFKKCNIKNKNQMCETFAYILKLKFKKLKCKYFNNFISQSKCTYIINGKYDNGRIISADELEIVLTDVDFNFILKAYSGTYEIIESYFARYDYLPKELIDFILEKYKNKTKFKGIKEKELEYNIEKAKFNSIYGMCVTNNIKDLVEFSNETGWSEKEQSNDEILEALEKEKKKGFLSFSWGVWVTAHARCNLLYNVLKHDKYVVYCDTDSIKVKKGFNESYIEKYNDFVMKRIEKASSDLKIPIDEFCPEDIKGKKRYLGVFDLDGEYIEFITQGAKKYAYRDKKYKEIHITVSGIPKKGSKALKELSEFKDNFTFEFKDTGKLLSSYNDEQDGFLLEDYKGSKYQINDKYTISLIPTTYTLGKSQEYAHLISDESSKRSIFKE